MEIGQPSRFACLKIEDDDASKNFGKPKNKKKDAKKPAVSSGSGCKTAPKSDKGTTTSSAPKKAVTPCANTNNKQQQNVKKDKSKQQNLQQWEEWKEKDKEIMNGTYESDLEKAIMASLECQSKKDLEPKTPKSADSDKSQNKKKKNKAMSLDQFLKSDKNPVEKNDTKTEQSLEKDGDFFAKVQLETKKELNKEEVKEIRKKREANIDEIVSQAQYQEKLQQERKRVEELERLLQQSKEEIVAVKERNKTLCNLLSNGEMKDKASALLEIENITAEKGELMAEVSRLHIENQQLRSKLASSESVNNKHKEKKRKPKGA